VTWFLGADNYFSHPADDSAGHRLALATLMTNGHARPSQIQKTLGTSPRSLVRWRKQLDDQGSGSFYQLRAVRGAAVLNVETSAQCQLLLDEGHPIAQRATLLETLQSLQTERQALQASRRATPRKIAIQELPQAERPRQLLPLAKTLTDTVKMIAYRAETALVGLLRRHLANEAEARALIRELFVSGADLEPDDTAGTLTIRIHRMASPVHDRAITQLLDELTTANDCHPETGHRFIYQLV
jgi:hypothetical protein